MQTNVTNEECDMHRLVNILATGVRFLQCCADEFPYRK